MADDKNHIDELAEGISQKGLETLGDTESDEALRATLDAMDDLELGHLAGAGDVLKGLVCTDENIESGALDGTCRIFDAAHAEYSERKDGQNR